MPKASVCCEISPEENRKFLSQNYISQLIFFLASEGVLITVFPVYLQNWLKRFHLHGKLWSNPLLKSSTTQIAMVAQITKAYFLLLYYILAIGKI